MWIFGGYFVCHIWKFLGGREAKTQESLRAELYGLSKCYLGRF